MSDYSSVTSTTISLAINLIIVGAFFAAGIALTFRLARPLSPRLRYVVALIGFLAAAALPVNSTLRGSRESAVPFQASAPVKPEQQPSTAESPLNLGGNVTVDSSDGAGIPAKTPPLRGELHSEPPGRIVSILNMFIRRSAESWTGTGFLILWAFVSFVLLGREVCGYIRLARARRGRRAAGPKVLESLSWPDPYTLFISDHEGPYTVGLFRPAVVIHAGLLEDLSLDEARLIARHELAHARWRDPLVNALVRVIRALLWPSLPLWVLARVVRVEREAAADLYAIEPSRHADIKSAVMEYASLLVLVARLSGNRRAGSRDYHWVTTGAGDHVDLESRVLRLLNLSSRVTRARLLLALLALTATAWGAFSLPIIERPLSAISGSEISDAVLTRENKASSAGQTTGARAGISRSAFPVSAEEELRPTSGEPLTRNDSDPVTAESAARVQSDSTAVQDQNVVALTSTPLSTRPSSGESNQDAVNEMAVSGYTGLSPEQLAAMKTYGVSAAYVREMAASGYGKLTADELINFRLLGVNSAYVKEIGALGYAALPANTMIDFRLYGVSSTYIKELSGLGLSNVTASKLVAFRRLGINAGYIRELKARGVENLTADGLIEARTQKLAASKSSDRGDTENE